MTDEERRKRLEEMSSDATKHLHARKQRLEEKALQDKKEMEKTATYTFRRVADEWLGSRKSLLSPFTIEDYKNKLV